MVQGRTLTPADVQATRCKLTQTALSLVDREGRDACSLRRVAQDAGISRQTPYTYFADKEALLDAVRAAALGLLADACEAAQAEGADVAARLRGTGQAYVRFALAHPALYDLIFEPGADVTSPDHVAASARYRALAEAPLHEAQALGLTVLEPARLGQVLWAATHGALSLQRAGRLRHGSTFEQLIADVGDTLAFGFLPRGEVTP